MQRNLKATSARNIKTGQIINLGQDRFERVKSIAYSDGNFIVGGPFSKTATALQLSTEEGSSFLIHPGEMVGVASGD